MFATSRVAARLGVGALCRIQSYCAETAKAASNSQTTSTVRWAQEKWMTRFESENIPEPEASITNIIAHVLELTGPGEVDSNRDSSLNDSQLTKIDQLCECRLARMPIQYIIREWDFRDLTLKMVPPVFIPRPETEELVELILQQVDTQRKLTFLEIGCGTGAISLSILKHAPMASAIAIDQSRLACELTQENANTLALGDRLRIFRHKLVDKLPTELADQRFDMIVSNPPYVPSPLLPALDPEVKIYEDLRALDGGIDGLTVIKAILRLASEHLVPDGVLWLEVDSTHPPVIEKYLQENGAQVGLRFLASYQDLFRKDRFVEIVKV